MSSAAILAAQDDRRNSRTCHPAATVKSADLDLFLHAKKVSLKGNPLKTVKENICPNCYLPNQPDTNGGGHPRYPHCSNNNFQSKPNCDIYGRPLKDVAKRRKRSNPSNSASESQPDSASPLGSPTTCKVVSLEPSAIPTIKCPNCPRSLGVIRVAQHLDRCLGLSGRQSGRIPKGKKSKTKASLGGGKPVARYGQGKKRGRNPEEEEEEEDGYQPEDKETSLSSQSDELWEEMGRIKRKRAPPKKQRKAPDRKSASRRGAMKTIPGYS